MGRGTPSHSGAEAIVGQLLEQIVHIVGSQYIERKSLPIDLMAERWDGSNVDRYWVGRCHLKKEHGSP